MFLVLILATRGGNISYCQSIDNDSLSFKDSNIELSSNHTAINNKSTTTETPPKNGRQPKSIGA